MWLELFNDYDFELTYHPDKAYMVADALSKKSLHMSMLMVIEVDLIEKFIELNLVCEVMPRSVELGMLKLTNKILEEKAKSWIWD